VAPPHTTTHHSRSPPPPPPPLPPYVAARAGAQTQAQHGGPFLSPCPYAPSLPLHPSMSALPLQKIPWNGRSVVSKALQTVNIWNMQHLMYIKLTKVKQKKQMLLQFGIYLLNQEQWCSLNMIQTGLVTEKNATQTLRNRDLTLNLLVENAWNMIFLRKKPQESHNVRFSDFKAWERSFRSINRNYWSGGCFWFRLIYKMCSDFRIWTVVQIIFVEQRVILKRKKYRVSE